MLPETQKIIGLENKIYNKKLEFERLLYKNSIELSPNVIEKNRKRMNKLHIEIMSLIEEIKFLESQRKEKRMLLVRNK